MSHNELIYDVRITAFSRVCLCDHDDMRCMTVRENTYSPISKVI